MIPGPPTGPAFAGPVPPPLGAPRPPAAPPAGRSRTGLILAIVVGVFLLVVVTGAAFVVFLGHRLNNTFDQASSNLNSSQQAPVPGGAAQAPYTPQDTPSDSVTPDTPTDAPSDTVAPLVVPSGGKLCDSSPTGGPYATAATGNDHTSCEFAGAVRDEYESLGGDGSSMTLTAHSPVTDKDYDMTCTASAGTIGSGPVTCTGGNDAVVLLGTTAGPVS
ncbi:hypothetical protein ABEG17_08450 [Pedococcus sp. KACC 23699]|uniref:Serine/threonine protein kinase n=1 Tax=Pedococcus sp. KACC 23699 TaxID=3149228 RepID=A0AAU7JY38_9MICO